MGFVLLTLFAPLIGVIITGLGGKAINNRAHLIAVPAIFLSWIGSVLLLLNFSDKMEYLLYSWVPLKGLVVPFGVLVDPLSIFMSITVTTVSLFVHIYSIGYMKGDPGYRRYFSYLNLFVFSMLLLVLSNNLLLLFVGWELVGLCSYLLIGHWYEKKSATSAAKKAFIVNRIGDAGFIIGILIIYSLTQQISYRELFAVSTQSNQLLDLALLFLFAGAIGKSAQFPLLVWLPDAMEGPTPVSSLIHAATMVTAGVYMTARMSPLYSISPAVSVVIVSIGVFTLFISALCAIFNDDIKRVLAYSTISQLGYMFTAVGLGFFSVGIFHLFTHAFFKSLLFLCAGSVLHATSGEGNIKRLGGLIKKMPYTGGMFLVGASALSGIPPLAGYLSKEKIIHGASESIFPLVFYLLLVGSLLTSFYIFRVFYFVFLAKAKDREISERAHESPVIMIIPMVLLAFLSIVAGFSWDVKAFLGPVLRNIGIFESAHPFIHPGSVTFFSIFAISIGIFAVYLSYHLRRPKLYRLGAFLKPIYNLLKGRFYFDEIYRYTIERPVELIAKFSFSITERRLIDGFVNAVAKLTELLGGVFWRLNTGSVRGYMFFMVSVSMFILWWFILR